MGGKGKKERKEGIYNMTIEEIASMAGVSRTAVSRYLNNGYISEEKKEKISKIIKETGYQPSRQAQMLRTKKTKLIGVVLPKINSEAVSRIAAGISNILSKEGFQILLANTENNVDKELEYLNLFKSNQVDGIIFIATILGKKHKEIFKNLKIPIIVVGQKVEEVSCIYHDDFNAAKELTEIMIKKGKRKIAYIGVTIKDKAAGLSRKNGYLEALKKNNIIVDGSIMAEGDFSIESGYEKMKSFFEQKQQIDAVFCATDSIAIGAMEYIKQINKTIPDEISIVGVGHTKMSQVVSPKLTTVHYFYKTSGIEAANMILSLLRQQSFARKEMKLGYRIIEQESTL